MNSSKENVNASTYDTSDEKFDRYFKQLRLDVQSTKKKKKITAMKLQEKEFAKSCEMLKLRDSPEKDFSNAFPRPARTECQQKKKPLSTLQNRCNTPRIRWQDLFSSSSDSDDEGIRKFEKGSKSTKDKSSNKKDVRSASRPESFESFRGFRDRNDANDFLRFLSMPASVDDAGCHPRAIGPLRCFKVYRTTLVEDLLYVFNKFVFGDKLPSDLNISWNSRMTSTAGFCRCSKDKITGIPTCSIELSTKLLTTADRVRDTLVHELCHAATWIVSNERDTHGPFWRAWARGANLMFPSLPLITVCHRYSCE